MNDQSKFLSSHTAAELWVKKAGAGLGGTALNLSPVVSTESTCHSLSELEVVPKKPELKGLRRGCFLEGAPEVSRRG